MCGTPHLSRTTLTAAESPGTTAVPEVSATSGGGWGLSAHPAAHHASANASGSTLRRMAIKDGLLAEFDHEMGTTRKLLERLPEDKLSWKPHEKSMSMGGLATHLANLPNWGGNILNEASFDLADAPPNLAEKTSRAEILTSFDETAKRTRAWLDKTDPELMAPWTLKRGGHEMFTMPRISAFRSFILYHSVHHRGQLTVYLRLNNVPLPAIYGPTADEGF
jgi:uncharacterized damage-inducible protein DinB